MNGGYVIIDMGVSPDVLPDTVPGAFERAKEVLKTKKLAIIASGVSYSSPDIAIVLQNNETTISLTTKNFTFTVNSEDYITVKHN